MALKPSFVICNDHDGREVFFGYNLFNWGGKKSGYSVRLHKFVAADDIGCFHTHPAYAIRIILWGGYVEEVPFYPVGVCQVAYKKRYWFPGRFGIITPSFEHRIDRFLLGKSSWSLFIRWPYTAEITTRGC